MNDSKKIEKIRIAAKVALERAPGIDGLVEHSLRSVELAVEDESPRSFYLEFRRGARGDAPGVELAVVDRYDEVDVTVNTSSSGALKLDRARDFSSLLVDVVFLADVVRMELDGLDAVPCPICGCSELERDPSDAEEFYCPACGRSFDAEEVTR